MRIRDLPAMAFFLLAFVLGAAGLVVPSALQKMVVGAPVWAVTGYVVPVLFGGGVGIALGYAYRQLQHRIERLNREIGAHERTLRQLRRFHRAIQATGHAVYITDEDGTIEYVNSAFESITGYSSDEAIGKNPRILRSGEMSEEYYADLWETVLAGDVWAEEVINERKDGELYTAYQTIAPITDSEGSIQAFVANQADITERKTLEEDLVETRERYESLFNSIQDAILVTDTNREIINCNPAFTDVFGYEFSEIEGKHTKYVYESEEEYQEMGEAIEGHFDDSSFTYTASYEKKSGQTFSGETTVSNFRNAEGDVIGFIGVFRDISERNQRLKQLQMVDRILQHNFSNDMNVIEGYAKSIYDGSDEPTRSQAATIIETSQKLCGTVQKERAVTDFLSGPSSVTTLDVGAQAQSLVSEIGQQYPKATISLDIHGHTTAQAVPELSLAIEQLLRNAVTHADVDDPTIRVRVEGSQDGVELVVSDENPTIPEMERAVLVEEAAVDPLYHGSGIGLWLVNLIVSHSDGTLEFRDNEPRGNVVSIRLPAALEDR